MNQEFIIDTLTKMGLSEEEVKIYIFLVKNRYLEAKDVVAVTKYNRIQVYRMLKNLQLKGMLEATLGFPSNFEGVPPQKSP